MAAKRSFTCYSIKCKEDSYNGWNPVHWCVFVKTPSQRGSSGICTLCFSCSLTQPPVFCQHFIKKCLEQLDDFNCFWQVTLFTRGKAPITQQLPGESDKDYTDFSSKVYIKYHLGFKYLVRNIMLSQILSYHSFFGIINLQSKGAWRFLFSFFLGIALKRRQEGLWFREIQSLCWRLWCSLWYKWYACALCYIWTLYPLPFLSK